MQNLDRAAFIHPTAQIYGAVELGAGSSIWPNTVIRSEMQHVSVGAMTNIQDFVMIHVIEEQPTVIGNFCSITHHVTVHGATIEDDCLIGIGAVIMDGAHIGRGSIVAGGAFIPEGKVYPPNSIIMGSPGKVRAERDSRRANRLNAWMYHRNAEHYARGEHRAWTGPEFEAWSAAKKAQIETDADMDEVPGS
ncbi:MAG: gamma carbonic anhydrase family protein [Actinomycetota bacterium]